MSIENERLTIPMDLELKWVKTKLHERDKHILKLAEENSKLRDSKLLEEDIREGISLRDHFAGLAMQGFIQYMGCDPEDLLYPKREQKNKHALSKSAYAYADAMLKERKKKNE